VILHSGPILPQRVASIPVRLAAPSGTAFIDGDALIDTGATFTSVRQDVATRLSLPSVGTIPVRGISGRAPRAVYLIRADLGPMLGTLAKAPVASFDPDTGSLVLLIGLDVLRRWETRFHGPTARFEIRSP